jgi:hypothetical protein
MPQQQARTETLPCRPTLARRAEAKNKEKRGEKHSNVEAARAERREERGERKADQKDGGAQRNGAGKRRGAEKRKRKRKREATDTAEEDWQRFYTAASAVFS